MAAAENARPGSFVDHRPVEFSSGEISLVRGNVNIDLSEFSIAARRAFRCRNGLGSKVRGKMQMIPTVMYSLTLIKYFEELSRLVSSRKKV